MFNVDAIRSVRKPAHLYAMLTKLDMLRAQGLVAMEVERALLIKRIREVGKIGREAR